MARKRSQKVVTETVPVCMDTIVDLDNGQFRRVGDKVIRTLLSDVNDRAEEDGKARHLSIDIEFIKVKGVLIITPRIQAKLPVYVCGSTAAKERVQADGELEVLFQPWNAENAEQPVFETDEESKGDA
jgi:hypothetical protein